MPQETFFPAIVVPPTRPLFIAVHYENELFDLHPKYGDYYNHTEEQKNEQRKQQCQEAIDTGVNKFPLKRITFTALGN